MTTELQEVKAPADYLPAEQQKEISRDLEAAKVEAASLRVVNDEAMEKANALCGRIRARQKGIEAFRVAIVKPFKDHLANIDKFFKTMAGQFDEPRELAEEKVRKYREKKIEAARKDPAKKEAPEKTSYQEGVGKTTFIKTAEFEITTPAAVPSEFYCIDEKKVGARVRELTKDLEVGKTYDKLIPGVVIKCTERPSYAGER